MQAHQCFLMPMSPYVITQGEIDAAPQLHRIEFTQAIQDGKFHDKYANARILMVPPIYTTIQTHHPKDFAKKSTIQFWRPSPIVPIERRTQQPPEEQVQNYQCRHQYPFTGREWIRIGEI
mmetsp:Transcript_21218/g.32636  ORF Transcript_21218/g.32636 Transcript_21218/m.32636 type:complete len:120 (-) Transcript_21218:152-511(-)